ncbi:hypothetical protein FHS14_006578 [Paenibacillus baekrokdamisoli]|nr:hypothetical protein [Paenibacillus baekrokdamisoli]
MAQKSLHDHVAGAFKHRFSQLPINLMNCISHDLNFSVPDTGTHSSYKYYASIKKDLDLFFFILNTIMISDYIPYHARMTLEVIDGKANEEDFIKSPEELLKKNPGKNVKKLRKHSQELLEMILSRVVDNFQVYIVSLIREVLVVKPEILHNKQPSISIEQVLKSDSIEALLQEVIESKISSLANKGFGNIEEWCLQNGIPLVVDNDRKEKIVEFIALRNIIVHNRCIVDDKFLKAVPRSKYQQGAIRELEVDDLYDVVNTLGTIVTNTDESTIQKYCLNRNLINSDSKFRVEF